MELIKSNHNLLLSSEQKEHMIEEATKKYSEFLTALRFDWENDIQMKDTPRRVAKMYVNELFKGSYDKEPTITEFENIDDDYHYAYDGMVFQGNIKVESVCCHHIIPFVGNAYIAYIPAKNGTVIGLSKLNRIVEYFARRPQIQENLTMQIHKYIDETLKDNKGVAVVIQATHLCVKMRGVKHDSTMMTSKLSGAFIDINGSARKEFYDNIKLLQK